MVAAFSGAGCLTLVADAQALGDAVAGYLADPARCVRDGELAARVVADNTGATERLMELLRSQVRAAVSPDADRRPSGAGSGAQ